MAGGRSSPWQLLESKHPISVLPSLSNCRSSQRTRPASWCRTGRSSGRLGLQEPRGQHTEPRRLSSGGPWLPSASGGLPCSGCDPQAPWTAPTLQGDHPGGWIPRRKECSPFRNASRPLAALGVTGEESHATPNTRAKRGAMTGTGADETSASHIEIFTAQPSDSGGPLRESRVGAWEGGQREDGAAQSGNGSAGAASFVTLFPPWLLTSAIPHHKRTCKNSTLQSFLLTESH